MVEHDQQFICIFFTFSLNFVLLEAYSEQCLLQEDIFFYLELWLQHLQKKIQCLILDMFREWVKTNNDEP